MCIRDRSNSGGFYAPEEGRKKESYKFYQQLYEVIDKVRKSDFLVIAGNLNARLVGVWEMYKFPPSIVIMENKY